MSDAYSSEYTYGNYVFRTKVNYTATTSNTAVSISGTVYLQVKSSSSSGSTTYRYIYGGMYTYDGYSLSDKNIKYTSYFDLNKTTTYSSWTSYASITFSTTWTRYENHEYMVFIYPGITRSSSTTKPTAKHGGNVHDSVKVPILPYYHVTYNINGGSSGVPPTQTKTYGVSLTLSSAKPTRSSSAATSYTVTYNHNYTGSTNATATAARTTSYTFSKWNTKSDGSGTGYAAGGTYTTNADATLYAQWTSSTSTAAISLRTPTRTGYTFGGWYKEQACTNKVGNAGASYTPTGNITLYAKWTANTYSVKYNANGGSGTMSNSSHTYDTAKALTANAFTAPAGSYTLTYNLNYDGSTSTTATPNKVFSSWNTNSSGTGTSYANKASVKNLSSTSGATVNLYAIWGNGSVTLSTPTRTGYTFGGWYGEAACTTKIGNAGASYTVSANKTIYAKWTINTYTVDYDGNGATSGSTSSQTKTYGTDLTLRANGFTRTGYDFVKWNTKADGTGTSYGNSSGGGTYTGNAAVTLYAIWTKKTYSVTYNGNGTTAYPTTGTTESQTKTYGTDLTLRANGFTRTGFSFKRWNTNTTDTGTGYNASATYTGNAALTLYAIWNRTVSYNANGGVGEPTSQTAISTSAITLQSVVPTMSGYSFAVWNTKADGSGDDYAAGGTFPANTPSTVLYAQYGKVISGVSVGAAKVIRVDSASDTDESDDGEHAYITVPFTCTGAASADIELSVTVSADEGVELPTVTLVDYTATKVEDADLSGTLTARAAICSAEKRYSFTVTVSAKRSGTSTVLKSATKMVLLPIAFFTMDVLAGGHGMGIGMPATREALDIGMPVYVHNNPIRVTNATSPIFIALDSADLSQSDNGITTNTYPGFRVYDTLGRIVSAFETPIKTDGTAQAKFYVRNYADTSTSYVGQKGMNIQMDKQGNAIWTVDEPGSFRSAIGALGNSGDIATGILNLKSTNIDRDGVAPASNATGNAYYRLVDKDGDPVGTLYSYRTPAKAMRTYLNVINEDTDGNPITKTIYLALGQDGSSRFQVPSLLTVQNTNLDRDGENPSSTTTANNYLRFEDLSGEYIGSVYPRRLSTGEQRLAIAVINEKTDGTQVSNVMSIGVKRDGTRTFAFDDAAAFRVGANVVGCGDQSAMDANVGALSSAGQWWALWANCTNSANTTENGHRMGLCANNTGVFGYRSSTGGATAATLWSFTTQNTSASGTDVITMASNHTLDSAYYYARNGVVQVRISFKTSSTATGTHTVGTIVSGRRPCAQALGAVSSSIISNAILPSSGALTVYFNAAPSTSSVYQVYFTYLLASGDQA